MRGLIFVLLAMFVALTVMACVLEPVEENGPCGSDGEMRCYNNLVQECVDGAWDFHSDCDSDDANLICCVIDLIGGEKMVNCVPECPPPGT